MSRVAFSVEGGNFRVVDVSGRGHQWPVDVPRTVVLQTDLCTGSRHNHGSFNSLLVLDGEGRTLVSAPRRPFAHLDVEAFCRANGLALETTARECGDPIHPPKGAGHVRVRVTRQMTIWQIAALVAGMVVGLIGPFPFFGPFLAGAVVALVLLFVLA